MYFQRDAGHKNLSQTHKLSRECCAFDVQPLIKTSSFQEREEGR